MCCNPQTCFIAEGLQCFQCSYYHADSDSSILSILLGNIKRFSDTHCKLETRDDREAVRLRNCLDPDNENEEMKCVELHGTSETTIFSK